MCSVPGVISAGAVKVTDQMPPEGVAVAMLKTGFEPSSAYRFIESVPSGAVPVIVMSVVQSVTSA